MKTQKGVKILIGRGKLNRLELILDLFSDISSAMLSEIF
jgi:hypothetical protein